MCALRCLHFVAAASFARLEKAAPSDLLTFEELWAESYARWIEVGELRADRVRRQREIEALRYENEELKGKLAELCGYVHGLDVNASGEKSAPSPVGLRGDRGAPGGLSGELGGFEEPKGSRHGATLFLTKCAGGIHFYNFCGPFLASFERAYGTAASTHRVVAFVAAVDVKLLDAAVSRFKPWFHTEALEDKEGIYQRASEEEELALLCHKKADGRNACHVGETEMSARDSKIVKSSTSHLQRVAQYIMAHGDDFCFAILIDSDTLFVRPLGDFLPKCSSSNKKQSLEDAIDWDVGISIYDKHFLAPWATSAVDVGRTAHNLSRVNSGVVLVSLLNVSMAAHTVLEWAVVCRWMAAPPDAEWELLSDVLVPEFRHPDQAALVLLLASFEPARLVDLIGWESCALCSSSVQAQLSTGGSFKVRFRAFPARIINHAESLMEGALPSDVAILHLKGIWWRMMLTKTTLLEDATRTLGWNRGTFVFRSMLFNIWEASLPEDLMMRDTYSFFTSQGENVTDVMRPEIGARRGSLSLLRPGTSGDEERRVGSPADQRLFSVKIPPML